MAQDYKARLRIPVDGDPAMRLFTRSGTLVADGYLRVVIGGRWSYIEFQTVWQSHMRVPAEELYRFNDPHVYYAEYRSHDKSDVKVYWQKKTVDYADYRVGRYYISPFDLVDGECRGKIEMSYLGKVEMSYCPHEKAAIPSINIVLHRGQPSRLPSGAKAGGLDGARPRRDKNS